MEQPVMTPLQQALDLIEQLPASDQEVVIEIVRQRLIERWRTDIARHAAETLQAFREGRARVGTVDDLRRDLLDEPWDAWSGMPAFGARSSGRRDAIVDRRINADLRR